jgi:heterodisulfide reductase subunit A-like polyferredoxin
LTCPRSCANRRRALAGRRPCREVKFACFPEGVQHIQARIQADGLNRVVVAGCSNRTHDALFQRTVRQAGLNPYLLELVNLRDQCAHVHGNQPELANRKALELIRMAAARVQLPTRSTNTATPPTPPRWSSAVASPA